jgi:hypothetical protein
MSHSIQTKDSDVVEIKLITSNRSECSAWHITDSIVRAAGAHSTLKSHGKQRSCCSVVLKAIQACAFARSASFWVMDGHRQAAQGQAVGDAASPQTRLARLHFAGSSHARRNPTRTSEKFAGKSLPPACQRSCCQRCTPIHGLSHLVSLHLKVTSESQRDVECRSTINHKVLIQP